MRRGIWGRIRRSRQATTTADTTAPTAPGSLTATAPTSTQVNLSWTAATDNVGVTGYRVERCQGADARFRAGGDTDRDDLQRRRADGVDDVSLSGAGGGCGGKSGAVFDHGQRDDAGGVRYDGADGAGAV